jgi:hypothetical protein
MEEFDDTTLLEIISDTPIPEFPGQTISDILRFQATSLAALKAFCERRSGKAPEDLVDEAITFAQQHIDYSITEDDRRDLLNGHKRTIEKTKRLGHGESTLSLWLRLDNQEIHQ